MTGINRDRVVSVVITASITIGLHHVFGVLAAVTFLAIRVGTIQARGRAA
jgi:hypothetical protein